MLGKVSIENQQTDHSNLVDLLRYRGQYQPDKKAYTFLENGEIESERLTYQEVDRRSRTIAAQLQKLGLVGERALLLYPPGLEFIVAFLGCLYAGVIAVPAYPPRRNQKLRRLLAIAIDSQAKVALTTESLLVDLKTRFSENTEITRLDLIATDCLDSGLEFDWSEPTINSNSLAFLQYTSGSTGTPKGVMVSHGNLLHNLAVIHKCFEHRPNSRGLIWLPAYHDMGLIGGVLQPIYGSFPVILMSPLVFLQKPWRWLQAISDHRATTSGGPNFAYDLCLRKVKPEHLATLDLSSWEVAFTGGSNCYLISTHKWTNIPMMSRYRGLL